MELPIVDGFGADRGDGTESLRRTGKRLNNLTVAADSPVNSVSRLAAGVIADFNVALEELHCNVIIVTVVQQDAIILSCRNLKTKCFLCLLVFCTE